MWKYLPFAFKNLLRNRRRTILTVLSVTVSLFLLAVLLSAYAAFYFQEASEDSALRVITRHRVSLTQTLPQYYDSRIREIPGVEEVCTQDWFGGMYIDERPEHFFPRFAVDADKLFSVYPEFTPPSDQRDAFLLDQQGMAIGASLADQVGLKLGQRITIKGDIWPVNPEFVIRAIFGEKDDRKNFVAFFHRKYLQESLPKERQGLAGTFVTRGRSTDDVPRIAKAVDEMFRNSPQPTKTESEAAFQLGFVNQLGNIKLFLLSIAAAITFTILLVSANTVAMSVRERISEIGVLKTLGFTSGSVLFMLILESMAMALLGGVLGVALCLGFLSVIGSMMFAFGNLNLPTWGIPVCLGAALLIGLLSSIVPASLAARTRITEALRHTG